MAEFIRILAQVDDAKSVLSWLTSLGGFGITLIVSWMVLTGRLVLKREIERERGLLASAERSAEEWKRLALRGNDVTVRSQAIADKAIEIAVTAQSSQQGPAGPQGIQGPPGPRG